MIPFELRGVTCVPTELSARAITNSGMVGLTEVYEQRDVSSKRSNTKKVTRVNGESQRSKGKLGLQN